MGLPAATEEVLAASYHFDSFAAWSTDRARRKLGAVHLHGVLASGDPRQQTELEAEGNGRV